MRIQHASQPGASAYNPRAIAVIGSGMPAAISRLFPVASPFIPRTQMGLARWWNAALGTFRGENGFR